MARQSTGKHAHKDSREPQPHTKESQRKGGSRGGGQHERAHEGAGSEQASGGDDLKQREYKDKDGNIHHHTHSCMDQHKGEGGGGRDR